VAGEEPEPKPESEAIWMQLKQKAEAERDMIKAALEAQKALAVQQLDIVKAQQGLLSQLLPKGETKPLEGAVTAGEKYEALGQVIAHEAVNSLADRIAEEIRDALPKEEGNKKPKPAVILIVDSLDIASNDAVLVEVQSQIRGFAAALDRQTRKNNAILGPTEEPPASVAPLALITSILPLALGAVSTLADIAGYFKTDYTVKGMTFDLKREVLVSALAGNLHDDARTIYIERFYPLDESPTLSEFANAQQQAVSLQTTVQQLSSEIIEPASGAGGKQRAHPKLNEAKAAVQASQVLLTAFDGFTKSVTAAPDDKSAPKLVLAALRQRAKELKPTHRLCPSIQFSAGEVVTSKSRLEKSDVIRFVGGVTVFYVLAEASGAVIASGNRSKILKWDCPLSGDEIGLVDNVANLREH
jgi:hypothetical protein